MTVLTQERSDKYWNAALWLALFTILYNLAEGLVSIHFGAQDEALTLFGFGIELVHRGHLGDRDPVHGASNPKERRGSPG